MLFDTQLQNFLVQNNFFGKIVLQYLCKWEQQ